MDIMKKIIVINLAILLLVIVTIGCTSQQTGPMNDQQPTNYKTAAEAFNKARADLLGILRTNPSFVTGVDTGSLSRAIAGDAVRQFEIDFNKLLRADSSSTFSNLQLGEVNTIYPLVADRKIVTVALIKKLENGWQVTGLSDKSLTDDLNAVRTAVGETASISVYHLPNLQTNVYAVKNGDRELYFLNYGDRFTLREGVPASALLPFLRTEASDFQKRYGNELKRQKLVR